MGAALRRSWYAAAWNHFLLAMPVHPLSSQSLRFLVSPSITYLESETQRSGVTGSASCRATMRAASSPVWLDCSSPGILIARFSG